MGLPLNFHLEKYFVMTIVCSECEYMLPVPESTEIQAQPAFRDSALISLNLAMSSINAELGKCLSCGKPTILQIRAVNKSG